MELGKDLISALRERLGAVHEGDPCATHPDWHALRASQLAASAVRRELLAGATARPVRAASFAQDTAARLLAGYDHSQCVNQTASGDGKYPSGNALDVAAATKAGDRGL